MRRIFVFLVVGLLGLAMAGATLAADAPQKRDRNWTPSANDATVGVLGGARKDAPYEGTPSSSKQPAAIPAIPVPKVESGERQVPADLSAAPSLPAAPRSDVRPEGPAVGTTGKMGGATMAALPPIQPTGFLPDHPFLSGVVAGLVGTEIGSIFYGGTMQGEENGVILGYVVRAALIIGVAVLVLRLVWRLMGGRSGEADDEPYLPMRREPTFKRGPAISRGGRREPTLGRDSR